ncbi:hypothetical protein OAY90_02475 [Candidatus Pelagibacter sp.]|nr:hypothetical protein [Candidatus Pelagibacter sp.]
MEYIYPSSSMGDVFVYFYLVDYLRDLNFEYSSRLVRVIGPEHPLIKQAYAYDLLNGKYKFDPSFNAAIFLSLIPIPFIVSTASLGFSNKLVYILTIIYLKNKKSLHDISLLVFLFFPSLLFYTSVGLKDTMVWSFSCLCIYFFIKKKYFFLLIFFTLLFAIKWTNSLVILFFLFAHTILFSEFQKKLKIYLISFSIFLIFLFFFFYDDTILYYLNKTRTGQWAAGQSQFFKPDIIYFDFRLIFECLEGLRRFFFSPNFYQVESTMQLFVLFENFLSISILLIVLVKSAELNKRRAVFWFGFLIAFALMYGITTINFGTLNRWKLSVVMVYIFASLLDCSLNEKKKKNILYN